MKNMRYANREPQARMIGLLLAVESPPATLWRPAIFTTLGGDGGIVRQNHMMFSPSTKLMIVPSPPSPIL